MLQGKVCKVGSMTNHLDDKFSFYEGVISSEIFHIGDEEFRMLILVEGKLVIADTYFVYDISDK